MDFDNFDAPKFVDFSRPDFDDSNDGDSWFTENIVTPLEVETDSWFSVDEDKDDGISEDDLGDDQDNDNNNPSQFSTFKLAIPERIDLAFTQETSSNSHQLISSLSKSRVETQASEVAKAQAPFNINRGRIDSKRASLNQKRLSLIRMARRKSQRQAQAQIEASKNAAAPEKDLIDESSPKRAKLEVASGRLIAPISAVSAATPFTASVSIVSSATPFLTSSKVNPVFHSVSHHGVRLTKKSQTTKAYSPSFGSRKRVRDDANPAHLFSKAALDDDPAKRTVQSDTYFKLDSCRNEAKSFQARPMPHPPVFKPKPCTRPRTVFQQFHFLTEDRAAARKEATAVKAQSEARLREVVEMQRRDDEAQEKEELKRFRQTLVHKAQPFLPSRPFVVEGSKRNLTKPESPNLSYKQASNSKRQS